MSDRWLRVLEDGVVEYSPEMRDECSRWSISEIVGKTREQSLVYLDRQVTDMNSDGVDCDFLAGLGGVLVGASGIYRRIADDLETGKPRFEYVAGSPTGACICARLLMMLHDLSEDEATRQMFLRLQELRGKEVRGRA